MNDTFNPGKETFGFPYHANTGVPEWVFFIFLIVVAYVAIRVVIDYKKYNQPELNKDERELNALKELLGDKINSKPKARNKTTKK